MQLKKSGRDNQYPGRMGEPGLASRLPAYDDEPSTDDFAVAEPSPAPEPARPAPPPARAPAPVRTESLVDAHSSFDGRYQTDHDLRVEGTISGEVVCGGLLTIECDATAKATLNARDAHLRGRIDGEITCSGRLLIASSAVVSGTVRAAVLVVEEGATLSGSVETSPGGLVEDPVNAAGAAGKSEPGLSVVAREEARAVNVPGRRNGGREVPSFGLAPSPGPVGGRN